MLLAGVIGIVSLPYDFLFWQALYAAWLIDRSAQE